MALQIITNHHERQFKLDYEVPDTVLLDDYNHLDYEDKTDGWIHYRNTWYHITDFHGTAGLDAFGMAAMDVWDGVHGDSFFSGVLIKLADDGETYQVATYIS